MIMSAKLKSWLGYFTKYDCSYVLGLSY